MASGFTANPETSGQDPRRIARDSLAIATRILEESGYDQEDDEC